MMPPYGVDAEVNGWSLFKRTRADWGEDATLGWDVVSPDGAISENFPTKVEATKYAKRHDPNTGNLLHRVHRKL